MGAEKAGAKTVAHLGDGSHEVPRTLQEDRLDDICNDLLLTTANTLLEYSGLLGWGDN